MGGQTVRLQRLAISALQLKRANPLLWLDRVRLLAQRTGLTPMECHARIDAMAQGRG